MEAIATAPGDRGGDGDARTLERAIPNLIVPVINRFDLLVRLIASIDHPVARLHIIDNSAEGIPADLVASAVSGNGNVLDYWVSQPAKNLGVAASWNYGIKQHVNDGIWFIANVDTEFGSGDLAALLKSADFDFQMSVPSWIGINGDWRVFALNIWMIRLIGWFDENFVPIYCEDADYERRAFLAKVPARYLTGTSTHVGSATINSSHAMRARNDRTYALNVEYYRSKWGGLPRHGEIFKTPFSRDVPLSYWELDPMRLASQSWD